MKINIKNDNLSVCEAVCRTKSDFSTECDVIVPDSKPDILNVLQLSAKVKVTNCETQNERVIISGVVKINILYLADNEEKSVKSIDTSCVFTNLFQNSSIMENMLTIGDVEVASLSYNIANCRKITVKTVLTGKIKVYSMKNLDLITDIEGACVKKKNLSSTIIASHGESTVNIQDSFEISQSKDNIKEILKTESKITDSDIKIIDDKAIVKGNISVTTLYVSQKGIEFMESELPFANVFDVEGLRADMNTDYSAKIVDLQAVACEDADGNLRILDVNAELHFRVMGFVTISKECITDAYIPRGALECKTSAITVSGVEKTLVNQVSIKETINLPESYSPIDTVYNVIARPFVESCELEEDKMKIRGYSEIYVLYLTNDKDAPVYSYKENIDFSVTTDMADCSLIPNAECEVKTLSYTLSGDKNIEIRGSLEIKTECVRYSETEIILDAKETEYVPVKRPSIIVSYANDRRGLWHIAKEYNVSGEEILMANGMENEEEITEGKALIIPK